MGQKIVPHLWFDKEANEAAEFYTSLLPDSVILSRAVIKDTPSGDCDDVSFRLAGMNFRAISAGPDFTFNPSISLMVNFDPSREADAREKLSAMWEKLFPGSEVLMPIGEYPFSSLYGWLQDRFGLSWQLILSNPDGEPRPVIVPSLLFTGDVCGRAEEALDYYTTLFEDSHRGLTVHYPEGDGPDAEGSLMFGDGLLGGMWMAAMDSGYEHGFAFNESVSFIIRCNSQQEINYYWEKLSAVPEAEQCGWLKDRFGVSWQVVPSVLESMMSNGTPEQIQAVTRAFLSMKKFDVLELTAVYNSAASGGT